MKKITIVALMFSGCASMRAPVQGIIYNDTQTGVSVTSNLAGSRIGESCASSYLGLVALGDASIEAARRNGGITSITSVDETFTSYLGLYSKYCTLVRGK